ncbi:hypothetical protein CAC42_4054 [Sphaceloma murrayae]|uniref:Peroxin/Ferlin domain-containing protein n=1 Tax=Sphaceloma murrayae TaxID=2082308 RepID=A0A2K1QSS5_9PEZI|nr:hypothetical protein CAC42_4054 [Sphaceloma murrayae]
MSTAGASSRPESLTNTPPPEPRDHGIVLLDRTRTQATDQEDGQEEIAPLQGGSNQPSNAPLLERNLSRRWTRTSLQHARTQRKYRRYQEDRIAHKKVDPGDTPVGHKGKRERGKTLVKDFWRGKKIRQTQEEDAIIEVLYENQRGFFTFGVPHFSSKSLLNFDPKSWTNARMRGSPVNITNAQVPDPNWEWAWKSWYVDMSRDVDEDGWEYSLAFYGCPWHGNHPWFHSFVRRRRWLRKRVRKHAHHAHGGQPGSRHIAEAHMLTPDYFTIHPSKTRSIDDTRAGSIATSTSGLRKSYEDDDRDAAEVRDIASLLMLLRRATIDREKIVLIRRFIRNADDELHYLSEEMPHIMSMLMFQSSRRDLLKLLMDDLARVSEHRKQHKSEGTEEGEREAERISNLLAATDAADKQVKRLEYWSDIRSMVREGRTAAGVDASKWDPEKWAGLDTSGPLSHEQSEAKEPGKSENEMQKEMQLLEKTSTSGSGEVASEQGKRAGEAEEIAAERGDAVEDKEELPVVFSSGDEYRTADETPIDLHKGKGREA